ncbi:Dolichyl-diphosphooligosaccharide--protein glycosyltransferase subunit SWP1 [Spathaspora sp. JA1]|nr:Dolichyl-diphosphooligosaccharide--protein glycosyltransferase subunit SWP1 [Spathaspora sp. JA1]
MKCSIVIAILNLLVSALALSNLKGVIKIGNNLVHIDDVSAETKQLNLDSPKDSIIIELTKDAESDRPEQILLALADATTPSIVTHFIPIVSDDTDSIKTMISVAKLPEVLKSKDKLILSIIIAGSKSSDNLHAKLVEILPSADFKQTSTYVSTPRIGIQPEIHHQFKSEEKTINPIFPIVFIIIAGVIFLGLVGYWTSFIGSEFARSFKRITSGQLLYNVSFLITIVGFELNFARYYFGQSIFTTLFYGFFLAISGVYFGVRVLRSLAINRTLEK